MIWCPIQSVSMKVKAGLQIPASECQQERIAAFRRFRTETLRRARVPEYLIGLWLGHASRTVTDLYASGLHQDQA
jgi:hypothetical protein